jgi:hypothetical protein
MCFNCKVVFNTKSSNISRGEKKLSKGLFTLEEWRRQILPKLVQECRKELLQKGALGKKGTRVNREALLACVRDKAKKIKEERLRQIAGR